MFSEPFTKLISPAGTRNFGRTSIEERFHRLFEDDLTGDFICTPEGTILLCNPAFAGIFGFSSCDTAVGTSMATLYVDPGERDAILAALRQQGKLGWYEAWRKRLDGKPIYVVENIVGNFDEKGELVEVKGYIFDNTERKRAEEKLRRLNETLEQRVAQRTQLAEERAKQLRALVSELTLAEQRERRRLAEILHDNLQQLLVAARINTEILAARIGAEHKPSAEKIENLINQSIEASRSLTAELSPPALRQGLLSAALEWLARWMQKRHELKVELKAAPGIDPVEVDIATLLFQSVRELLLNVVKHSTEKWARIEMARKEGNRLRVSVTDRGPGLDPDIVRDKAKAGTGFGLFSIRERLTLSGGNLEVDSSPGKGSTFSLIVPLETAEEKDERRIERIITEIHKTKTPAGKIRVLLADDHTVMRQGISTMLNLHPDIEVVGEAADGEAAIAKARALQPDVILMDISMPKMDGLEATRIIHSESPHIRIIGLSMYAAEDQAARMIGAGAWAYCAKDGDTDALLANIRGRRSATCTTS